MKFRRIVLIGLIVCMCLSLAGCKSGKAEAKKVTTDFMTALTTYDIQAMSSCLEDMPDNTDTVYTHDIYNEDYFADLYSAANTKLSYTVTSVTDKQVKLKVTMPDIYTLYKNVFMSVLSQTFTNDDMLQYVLDEENDPQLMIIALMINEIENNGIDTVDEEITLSIGKINGKYKILNDEQLEELMTSKLSLAMSESTSSNTDEENS